jgi:DNA-binding IclR family transcriptional regulator
MPHSKLEKYINVLEALAHRSLKLDSIAYKVKMECTSVKRSLDFLIKNGLVEKSRLHGKHEVYVISERGLSVFRTLRTLRQLEELKKTMPAAAEQISEEAAMLTEHTHKQR